MFHKKCLPIIPSHPAAASQDALVILPYSNKLTLAKSSKLKRLSNIFHGGLGLLFLILMGCSRPAGVIFTHLDKPIYWPSPPEKPRISYIGQLATEKNLKAAKSFFNLTGELLFGKKEARAMLSPYAMCTDSQGRLFVADSNGQMVHVFDLTNHKYAQWRPKGDDGQSVESFSLPIGIACDANDRLIVSDSVAGKLFTFSSKGKYLGSLGGKYLMRPCGVAVDRVTGRIFVADAAMHQIVVLDSQGKLITKIGRRGVALGEFNYPTSVAFDSHGHLYVSDSLNFRVQKFDRNFKPLAQIGSRGDRAGYFSQPKGIAIDSDDHLYVVDAHFEAIQVFDTNGQLLLCFGQEGHAPGQFWLPAGIHIDRHNGIWIADTYNKRVQVFRYLSEVQP